jgi:hypothetical protein
VVFRQIQVQLLDAILISPRIDRPGAHHRAGLERVPLLPATTEDLGDFSATDIPNPVNSSTVTSSYRTLYTTVVAALLIA